MVSESTYSSCRICGLRHCQRANMTREVRCGAVRRGAMWRTPLRCDSRDQRSNAFDPPVIEEVHCLSAKNQLASRVVLVAEAASSQQFMSNSSGSEMEAREPTSRMETAGGDIGR